MTARISRGSCQPRAAASSNNEGLLQDSLGLYWNADEHNTLAWVPINIFRAGTFRVRHFFYWAGLGQHRQRGITCRYS